MSRQVRHWVTPNFHDGALTDCHIGLTNIFYLLYDTVIHYCPLTKAYRCSFRLNQLPQDGTELKITWSTIGIPIVSPVSTRSLVSTTSSSDADTSSER